MDYPQYRKYKNGNSYFEILSPNEFIEYQFQLNELKKSHFEATILPDRNYIQDMLFDYQEHWELIEKEDLEDFLAKNSGQVD